MFFKTRNRLLELQTQFRDTEFSASTFTKLIRKQFPSSDYIFRTERSYAADIDSVISGGLYDSDNDVNGEPHTEITLYYHPEQMAFYGKDLNWDDISFNIAECVAHEQIHRNQFYNKVKLLSYNSNIADDNKRTDQNYLGHDEEIDAYAFSIAAESATFNKPFNMCSMYHVYRNTFDTDHSVIVKLEQQIVKYIEKLKLEPNNEQVNISRSRNNCRRHA
jgi:hypothetical protein